MTATGYWALGRAVPKRIAQLGLAILAGAGFVLALSPFSLLPFAFASFAILAVLLRHASPRTALGLGYLFGLGQFVPGLFWGWLYQRERSFISLAVSHALLGVWGLFVLGFPY